MVRHTSNPNIITMPVNFQDGSGVAGDTLVTTINTTAATDQAGIGVFGEPVFVFGLSEQVSARFIQVIQDFFNRNPLCRTLNTKLAKVNKEVKILDCFAPDTQSLPQIVVSSMPVTHSPISLGNRLGMQEVDGHAYMVYGGNLAIESQIELYELGKTNICDLADLLFLGLMQYIPFCMAQTQIVVQPNIRFTPASEYRKAAIDGEVFKLTLTVPVVSEWRQYMEIGSSDSPALGEFQYDITKDQTNLNNK